MSRVRRALAVLALAGGIAGLTGTGTAQAAACDAWQGVESASPAASPGANELDGVAVISACDVWMVGHDAPVSGPEQTLVEHWTGGGNWTVVPSPSPGSSKNELTDVAAASSTSIWAVGFSSSNSGDRGLLLHWDGSNWTQVEVPGSSTGLTAVTAASVRNVWVAGRGPSGLVLLHYDGTSWTQSPSPVPAGSQVDALSATSASDAWGVGQASLGTAPLILHWDGSSWSQANAPDPTPPGHGGTTLFSVSASSPTNAWAVGTVDLNFTITMHWDGHSWTNVPSPNPLDPASNFNTLGSVVAVSADSAYAVGDSVNLGASPITSQALLLHWDGANWARVTDPSTMKGPKSVAAAPGGILWLAGIRTDAPGSQAAAEELGIVPNVIGLSRAVAFSALNDAGVGAAAIEVTSPTSTCTQATNGTVVATSPAAGALSSFPTTLAVCSLPPPVTTTVPNVFGAPDSSARAAITAAGLTVGSVTREGNCAFPNATVWFQSPSGGTQVAPGSPVNLKEATGRQDNGRLCPPTNG